MSPVVRVGINYGIFLGGVQSLCLFLANFLAEGPGGCCVLLVLLGSVGGVAYLAGRQVGRHTGQQSTGLRAGVICAVMGRVTSLGLCFSLSAALTLISGPADVLPREDVRSFLAIAALLCGLLVLLDLALGAFGGWMGGNHGAAEAYASET